MMQEPQPFASMPSRSAEARVRRVPLGAHACVLAESLEVTGPRCSRPGVDDYSPHFQVCLPYRGAFVWHVGRDDVLADPNRVVFVTGDEAFRMSRPVEGGYAELIVTVAPELLSELLGVAAARLPDQPAFRDRSRPASVSLQRLGIGIVHQTGARDALAADERLIGFVRASLQCQQRPHAASPSTRRLVTRAKAYLADHVSSTVRLQHVAAAAGTTPAYLTTLFRQLEGQPLHKYLVRLRLVRALTELPHTSDITRLAADLGFASHSHFTAVFRRAFGCTPSSYRASARPTRAAASGRGRQATGALTAIA